MTARKAYSVEGQLFATIGEAVELADKLAADERREVKVVHRATDCIAHTATWVAKGTHFSPWTRVEDAKFSTPDMSNYVLAYTRSRIQTGVYRHINAEGWLVVNNMTGDTVECENTWEARQVTNAMRAGTWNPELTLVEARAARELAKANA